MLLKMAINSFLSHYAEGLVVLFCSILSERDRNPSSCGCRAVPPSQNYPSSAARQPASALGKAAAKPAAVVLPPLSRAGVAGPAPGPRSPPSSAAGPAEPDWTRGYRWHHSPRARHYCCPALRARRAGPLPPAGLPTWSCGPFGLAM